MENSTQLNQLFDEGINALQQFESTCQKIYRVLSKNAFLPELSKALDEEQTGIKHHIKRLKLIATTLQKSKSLTAETLIPKTNRSTKVKNLLKDVEIIDQALQLQHVKMARYEFLKSLATTIGHEHAPELLEQCIAENQATTTWITRTFHQSLNKIASEEQQLSDAS